MKSMGIDDIGGAQAVRGGESSDVPYGGVDKVRGDAGPFVSGVDKVEAPHA
jgi:hypothetical protein